MPRLPVPPPEVVETLRRGVVIPAHPLALAEDRHLDEVRQRALTRYYIDAGAGGIAVGVHTTQFAIREASVGLLRPVLEIASRAADEWAGPGEPPRPEAAIRGTGASVPGALVKVAGICGRTRQAEAEAELAADLGYHAGLLSLAALRDAPDDELIAHAEAVAQVIPLFGFYLQPAVGGRPLGYAFWRRFAEIPNVLAIKIAPFNRYQTLDVVRAVVDSGRTGDIALYTGNDDCIVFDLLSVHDFTRSGGTGAARIVGGLLGHWAFWTRGAVELLNRIHRIFDDAAPVPQELLRLAPQITDANSAVFDPRNDFAGCIPGIHEILRRQGLLRGRWTLDPREDLSPGQVDEIDRVSAAYPHLADDAFVAENVDRWLR